MTEEREKFIDNQIDDWTYCAHLACPEIATRRLNYLYPKRFSENKISSFYSFCVRKKKGSQSSVERCLAFSVMLIYRILPKGRVTLVKPVERQWRYTVKRDLNSSKRDLQPSKRTRYACQACRATVHITYMYIYIYVYVFTLSRWHTILTSYCTHLPEMRWGTYPRFLPLLLSPLCPAFSTDLQSLLDCQ